MSDDNASNTVKNKSRKNYSKCVSGALSRKILYPTTRRGCCASTGDPSGISTHNCEDFTFAGHLGLVVRYTDAPFVVPSKCPEDGKLYQRKG